MPMFQSKMRNLFVITARGGSKGVKNKNIVKINNIHLLGYKAISAEKSNFCDGIIITTDSQEIADIAKTYNVDVPFLRPRYLAEDGTSSEDTLIHAVSYMENVLSQNYDIITLLQPSAPFATYEHINNALNLFIERKADAVISVKEVGSTKFTAQIEKDLSMKNHYEKIKDLSSRRRQDLNKEYRINGALYIVSKDYFMKTKSLYSEKMYAYVMPEDYSVDIDTVDDLKYAEYLVKNGYIDLKYWEK